MDELKRYDLVDRYLRNELSTEELIEFDLAIKSDKLLQQELEDQKMIGEVLFSSEIKALQNQVKTEVDVILNKQSNWKWYISGVALLGLTTATLFFNAKDDKKSTAEKTLLVKADKQPVTKPLNTAASVNNSSEQQQTIVVEKTTQTTTIDSIIQNNLDSVIETTTINLASPESEPEILIENTSSTQSKKLKPEVTQEDKTITCSQKTVSTKINLKHEHIGKYDGEINVDYNQQYTLKEPVRFRITEIQNEFQDELTFTGLTSGNYHLQLQDGLGCVINNDKLIIIKPLNCSNNSEYILNTTYDPEVTIALVTSANTIEIRNKFGNIVYEINELIEDEFIWNGKNENEEIVESGLYLYKIMNENGSTCIGSITIVRN